MTDWDRRFLELARHIATWSKDPSTKVGAVIACGKELVSVGYNGFPPYVLDDERLLDRETKYKLVVHAEANAILRAGRDRLPGSTLYVWPFPPCIECSKLVLTSDISYVISATPTPEFRERWGENLDFAGALLREAGIRVLELNLE